jgi:hypothetical protein
MFGKYIISIIIILKTNNNNNHMYIGYQGSGFNGRTRKEV